MKTKNKSPYRINFPRVKCVREKSADTLSPIKERKITNSRGSYEALKSIYETLDLDMVLKEHMVALYLNRANCVIGYDHISSGDECGTVVDIKQIAFQACSLKAPGVIMCHNHPSGNLKPSSQDISITKQVRDGLKLLEVVLLDHLIITESGYYSMADESLI